MRFDFFIYLCIHAFKKLFIGQLPYAKHWGYRNEGKVQLNLFLWAFILVWEEDLYTRFEK